MKLIPKSLKLQERVLVRLTNKEVPPKEGLGL